MRPIFNKKIIKKYNLWDHKQYIYVLFIVDKVTIAGWKKKKKKKGGKREKENVNVQTKLSLNVSAIPTTALAGQV